MGIEQIQSAKTGLAARLFTSIRVKWKQVLRHSSKLEKCRLLMAQSFGEPLIRLFDGDWNILLVNLLSPTLWLTLSRLSCLSCQGEQVGGYYRSPKCARCRVEVRQTGA